MAKQPAGLSADDIMARKGDAVGIEPEAAVESRERALAAVQDAAGPESVPSTPRPETVTFVMQPSARVATANVQVRLPAHIARSLRLLSANLEITQQALMEKWITDGVALLWRQSQGGRDN